jgi:glycosyltransferase involved in cell wall biosynthesis
VRRHAATRVAGSSAAATDASSLGIVWEGSFFVHHSLANINREVALRLAHRGVDLGVIGFEQDEFPHTTERRYRLIAQRLTHTPRTIHCHVRHRWPPDFSRPPAGAFILVQPWEFGSLPRAWLRPIARHVDEAWVYTHYIRDVYLASGVAAEKVHVIPLGVNTRLFHPNVAPVSLDTRKRFKFLFVGGAILRKGFDVLLRAYAEEFTSTDDVCLVVKDFFYGGEAARDVAAVRRKSRAPEILYWYGTMPYHKVGGVYTACDCYVHPYRSEGFGLPILEAMACGLPVIVTGSGAARDFCNDDVAYLVPADERRVPAQHWDRRFDTVRPPRWWEPDRATLRRLMRYAYEERDEAKRKAARARELVARSWTWRHTVDRMLARLLTWR